MIFSYRNIQLLTIPWRIESRLTSVSIQRKIKYKYNRNSSREEKNLLGYEVILLFVVVALGGGMNENKGKDETEKQKKGMMITKHPPTQQWKIKWGGLLISLVIHPSSSSFSLGALKFDPNFMNISLYSPREKPSGLLSLLLQLLLFFFLYQQNFILPYYYFFFFLTLFNC